MHMNAIMNVGLIAIPSDIDVTTVARIRDTIRDYINANCPTLILNLRDVHYVDSAGMAMLWCTVRSVRAYGGSVRFVEVHPHVLRALKISRMVDYISVRTFHTHPIADVDTHAEALWQRVVEITTSDLAATRARVQDVLNDIQCSDDMRFDMMLAIGEAMGNVADHAHSDCAMVQISVYADRVAMDVSDCGQGFALDNAQTALSAPEHSYAERGRGIQLMRILVDEVSITKRVCHRGTRVHLVKLLKV